MMNTDCVHWQNSPFHNVFVHCYSDARFVYRLKFPVIQTFAQKPAIQKGFNYFKAFPILALLNFQWLHFYLSAIIGRKLCMLCTGFFFFHQREKRASNYSSSYLAPPRYRTRALQGNRMS